MQTIYVGSLHSQAQIMFFQLCFMWEETIWSILSWCLSLPDNNLMSQYQPGVYVNFPRPGVPYYMVQKFMWKQILKWYTTFSLNVTQHGSHTKLKFSFQSHSDNKYWSILENVGFITSNCSAFCC